MTSHRVLIIDDALEMAQTVAEYLTGHDFEARVAASGSEGLDLLRNFSADVVLTDLRMHEMDGLDVLAAVHRLDASTPVVIMTAFGAVESAVDAIRRGAYHYVTKPFKLDVVRVLLERAVNDRELRLENQALKQVVKVASATSELVGRSAALRTVTDLVARVAGTNSPVLLLGETGTGKELVARAIHAASPRHRAPFVAVNCAAVPESLLESELFGHQRGAFTGATQTRRGLFLEAHGGTLLLDEIGDMALPLQAKLLRVLQTGEVRAIGGDGVRTVDVRVIAATHRSLPDLVRSSTFREDLFFRLNVLQIVVPPLRQRREDIPVLIHHFLVRAKERFPATRVSDFGPEAMQVLMAHSWPGNVRELENLIERCVVTGNDAQISAAQINDSLSPASSENPLGSAKDELVPLHVLEQRYIAWVLSKTGGNKTRTAEILGIDPSTLYRRERQSKD